MNGLGDKIYTLRRKSNLSQEEFGEKIGVSRQAISQWETEAITPRADKINLMCEKFGVNWDYFFPQDDKKDVDNISAKEPLRDSYASENKADDKKKKSVKIIKILIIAFALAALLTCAAGIILAIVLPVGGDNDTSFITLNFSSPAVAAMFISCAVSVFIVALALIIKNIKK